MRNPLKPLSRVRGRMARWLQFHRRYFSDPHRWFLLAMNSVTWWQLKRAPSLRWRVWRNIHFHTLRKIETSEARETSRGEGPHRSVGFSLFCSVWKPLVRQILIYSKNKGKELCSAAQQLQKGTQRCGVWAAPAGFPSWAWRESLYLPDPEGGCAQKVFYYFCIA